ncbi:MAG: ABC transporter substrate-binding protein [Treponema sp.]|nr:ABC transporter substrate-binding protein [Treponema sp.]
MKISIKQTFGLILLILLAAFLLPQTAQALGKKDEISLEEADALQAQGVNEILAKTVSKPWRGEDFVPGKLAGVWNDRTSEEPKTFNIVLADGDATSGAIVNAMQDYLLDYDVVARVWKPRCASAEVKVNDAAGTLDVIYTLRDDLYWSYYNSDRKIKVTSDDIVFWYNELEGNADLQMTSYNGQFMMMQDGTVAHIDIEKIDDLRFVYHFPRIVAEPLLTTNTTIAPRAAYEDAYKLGGTEAVLNLFNVTVDPKTIPSMGEWFLTEYTPGQRLVYERNPNYWNTDKNGTSIPYYEKQVVRIIPDTNTTKLLFQNGEMESYSLRPEDLDEIIGKQGNAYTVFNAEGTLTSPFWVFNQNPAKQSEAWYDWFTKKEFRQAMSCLLNRDRMASQVYRGLAEGKYDIFPEPNPFYNKDITLQYRYDTKRALSLLASIGIKQDSAGVMRDSKGRAIEFDLIIQTDTTVYTDMASILMDELSKVGIKLNIRVLEFQKVVEMLTRTYDWQTLFISLSGSQIFPSQGSNVWPTTGNLHMWNPSQKTPATDWEKRVDYLYNEGSYTIDQAKAKTYWDEFQQILLEQCPLIYLMRRNSFVALSNRWDFSNVYFDNRNGFETTHIFLGQ